MFWVITISVSGSCQRDCYGVFLGVARVVAVLFGWLMWQLQW